MNLTQVHANNAEALTVIYNSLVILCKVFYSLNFQVSIYIFYVLNCVYKVLCYWHSPFQD